MDEADRDAAELVEDPDRPVGEMPPDEQVVDETAVAEHERPAVRADDDARQQRREDQEVRQVTQRVPSQPVETQRHLVFVHDSWFRRCCLGSTEPFTAIGLASEFVPDQEEQGLDRAAAPSLDEVLAARDVQGAELERWLSTMTADQLSAPAPVPAGQGWPPYAKGKSVVECVHVVLDEEWAHHGFCVRDLDLLGS